MVDERHEHLLATPLPLRDHLPHNALAHREPLLDEHLMQPRRRQSLLAAGPARSLVEELSQARPHALLDRARARDRRALAWLRALDVAPDRIARHSELARHTPHRQFLDKNLVPNHVDLIHP